MKKKTLKDYMESNPVNHDADVARRETRYHQGILKIVQIIDEMTADYDEGEFTNDTLKEIFNDVADKIMGY